MVWSGELTNNRQPAPSPPYHDMIPEDGEQDAFHVTSINILVQVGDLELHGRLLSAAEVHPLEEEEEEETGAYKNTRSK